MRNIMLACVLALWGAMPTAAQNATEIIQKSIDLVQGESNKATMRMSVIRPTWQRDVGMKAWSLGTDYSLIVITAPARDEGTAFLKRDQELWNWQPRIERSIKMPPSMMLQSWMGSDFTNDDLIKQTSLVEHYTHTLAGRETIEGRECYKIVLQPRPDAPVVWGKLEAWIDVDEYFTMKNIFYDEDGAVVNTMYGKEVRQFDDRRLPSIIEVVPADNPGQKTVVEYLDIEFNIPLEPSFFSIQNMKRIQ